MAQAKEKQARWIPRNCLMVTSDMYVVTLVPWVAQSALPFPFSSYTFTHDESSCEPANNLSHKVDYPVLGHNLQNNGLWSLAQAKKVTKMAEIRSQAKQTRSTGTC